MTNKLHQIGEQELPDAKPTDAQRKFLKGLVKRTREKYSLDSGQAEYLAELWREAAREMEEGGQKQ